jgi:hypothetical protein
MVVKSDKIEKSAAETAPAIPAPKTAAKKEEPSPNEVGSDEEEKHTAKVADKKVGNSSEESSDEDVAVGKVSQHIKPHHEKHAAKPAAEAATTEESSDRDRQNSDEEPDPNKAEQAERQPARQPKDNQPPAKHLSTAARNVSNVLAQETQHKPKENEQNRKKRSQEEQIETKDATTPMDEAPGDVATINHDKDDTEENAEWKYTQSDEPADLTPIHEEGGDDITIDDEETKEHNAEWKDNKSGEPANKSPADDENASTTKMMGELPTPLWMNLMSLLLRQLTMHRRIGELPKQQWRRLMSLLMIWGVLTRNMERAELT